MIKRAKISAVRANSFVVVEQFIRNSSNKRRIGGAALINFFVPDAALIRGRCLIEGGAYSSKYGTHNLMIQYIYTYLYTPKENIQTNK